MLSSSRLSSPVKKLGRILAPYWPWPIRTRVGVKVIYVDLRSAVGRGIFVTGKFDDEVFQSIRGSLDAGTVFLDVGANVGYYSLLAIDCVGPDGQVHAFEIDSRPLKCLRKTVVANKLNNLIIHEVALGQNEGTAYLAMKSDCGHSSAGSELQGIAVPMAPLDSFQHKFDGRRISAIKIDVEGAELAVINGAKNIIREHQPAIVCEVFDDHLRRHGHTSEQLMQCLIQFGYECFWLGSVHTPTVLALPCHKN